MIVSQSPVYVLGSSRIPFVKSQTEYAQFRRKDLMVAALNGLIEKHHLEGVLIGDTALGAVLNSVADFNLARETVLSTALHPASPGVTLQRACGTGLEATWQIALKVFTGSIELGIAGGVDTNSDLPIEMVDQIPRVPSVDEPRTHLSMGQHTERMVKEWQISRQAQDEFALRSHQRAAQAYEQGFFSDLITPFAGLNRDRILRADTSLEKLSRLPAAFEAQGSLTAGNSTALTDGAACVLMGGLKGAEMLGTQPLAKCVDFTVSAVDFVNGEGLLMAPMLAVAQLLQKHRLGFDDFDYIEIHEAFAGQVLANLKAWEDPHYCREVLHLQAPFGQTLGAINPARLNVNGSSLALGHPFAATGARIVGSLAKLLSQSRSQRGLISICTAGGMGMAAILESAD